jgi:hypothetical protein
MKKAFMVLPLVAALAACSTTSSNNFDKRADAERERQEKYVERSLDKAPKWMTELPESKSAVYAAGSAVSGDLGMADEKAKLFALGKICTTSGGTIDKRSKMYRLDTDKASGERSELAIQSACKQVDVTGVQVMEIKRVSEGTRYRSYVLIALPLGDTNVLRSEKDGRELQRAIESKSEKAFKEINGVEVTPLPPAAPISATPGEFKLMSVDNEEYKRRRDETLQKPGAVVGQVSVR